MIEPRIENYCRLCNMIGESCGLTFDLMKEHLFDDEGNQTHHIPDCPISIIAAEREAKRTREEEELIRQSQPLVRLVNWVRKLNQLVLSKLKQKPISES